MPCKVLTEYHPAEGTADVGKFVRNAIRNKSEIIEVFSILKPVFMLTLPRTTVSEHRPSEFALTLGHCFPLIESRMIKPLWGGMNRNGMVECPGRALAV